MQDSYRDLFLSESREYLNNISNCLVKLEEDPARTDSINEIFRCIHTLKGMSATMGYDKLSQLSHQTEDLLDEVRSKRKKLSSEIIDVLFSGVDIIEQLLQDVRLNKDSNIEISPYLNNLRKYLLEKEEEKEKAGFSFPPQVLEFSDKEQKTMEEARVKGLGVFKIVISFANDCVMKEARAYLVITNLKRIGELIKTFPSPEVLKEGRFALSFTAVLASKESKETLRHELLNISEIKEINVSVLEKDAVMDVRRESLAPKTAPSYIKKIQSMRIPVERLDKIMNLMSELAISRMRLMQITRSSKLEPLEEVSFILDRLISSLQDEIMQTRLLPVAYILDAFPRIVRDLSRKENKDVDLEMMGSEIELDRVVLDEISDPLIHLVRNAIDHGIENMEERKALGKDPRGKVMISVTREKGQIFIEVADDGKGVDSGAIRRAALNKGLISDEEAANIDEKKILELMTTPGFSTAEKITDISGRGVGLDVVKSKIEALGGRVDFETKPQAGSRFILTLPLTLAIIKAMLVKVQGEIFAIPLMNIRETIKLRESELKILQNFEVVRVREEVIPTIRLDKELGFPVPCLEKNPERIISLVIVEHGKKVLGLTVAEILGEQDIVVKPLGSIIKRTKGIAGATILGDGKVALILDTMSLR